MLHQLYGQMTIEGIENLENSFCEDNNINALVKQLDDTFYPLANAKVISQRYDYRRDKSMGKRLEYNVAYNSLSEDVLDVLKGLKLEGYNIFVSKVPYDNNIYKKKLTIYTSKLK